MIKVLSVCLESPALLDLRDHQVSRDQRDILEWLVLMDLMEPLDPKDPQVPMEKLVIPDLLAHLDLP